MKPHLFEYFFKFLNGPKVITLCVFISKTGFGFISEKLVSHRIVSSKRGAIIPSDTLPGNKYHQKGFSQTQNRGLHPLLQISPIDF